MPETEILRSVHTRSVVEILDQLGCSILVTTYQSGHLVMLRPDADVLNTHFRIFKKPMGLAIDHAAGGDRLAIGTETAVSEFYNLPAVASSLDPPGDNDAVYMPRLSHTTGNIQIHEMAYVGKGDDRDVVFINTAFSCLCRRSDVHSFAPIWRPSFIAQFEPGDSCHINGMAVKDDMIAYVTALGETNQPGQWRENKKDGGIVIDIATGQPIIRGLSMPHSPRWYAGRWWLLESGMGSFGTFDPIAGTYTSIVQLPGFTRGLSFAGPFAFIGLSQVRESAVFGGVPIAERTLEERNCGVWVVNIESGTVVGFVRFEDAVQEIFSVEVLPNKRRPDLVNDNQDVIGSTFDLSQSALLDVPQEMRS
ncbi:MAG: TIGR03032 family protein [Planctomycetota bacterium]